ncbi:hypothetical protein O3M35_009236 [Rhynocoris fuscipes]|uniref:Uncharacterized protein n=1 Tax=Rhynocoris fuscipes TaxID=488301 RepID=A0AAW1D9R6_9HEMI
MEEKLRCLEKAIEERDQTIKDLKNELDKFRQVVRPLTAVMTRSSCPQCGGRLSPSAYEPRIIGNPRRQAISAEPTQVHDHAPVKVPKSSTYVLKFYTLNLFI